MGGTRIGAGGGWGARIGAGGLREWMGGTRIRDQIGGPAELDGGRDGCWGSRAGSQD